MTVELKKNTGVKAAIFQKIKYRILREFFRTHSYRKKNAVDDLVIDDVFTFSDSWKETFLKAMRHNLEHHVKYSEFFRQTCAAKKFEKRLATFDEIWDIPFIMCDIFKHYDIETNTGDLFRTEFTSTGTSGRKSKVMIDTISGQRLLASAYYIYKALGMVSERTPVNYVMMAYNPDLDDNIGTTNSDVIISYFTPRKKTFFAIDKDRNGNLSFLKDETVENLREFVKEGLPIRILGFLHHTCEAVRAYNERYGRLEFPDGSAILTGGGWKDFVTSYGKDFNPFTFLKENSTIDLKNVRDMYSLSEHPIFYLECEHHNKHVPNVALACVRDPRTLERVPYGKTGLIHLYTPLIESTPLISILTTDYGYIGEACPCGKGPYVKILGRAGLTKKTTCSLTADQFIR